MSVVVCRETGGFFFMAGNVRLYNSIVYRFITLAAERRVYI